MTEMDVAARLGIGVVILMLLTALVLFHVFFLPPRPAPGEGRESPDRE